MAVSVSRGRSSDAVTQVTFSKKSNEWLPQDG
jgi:hypothetical protein